VHIKIRFLNFFRWKEIWFSRNRWQFRGLE